MSSDRRSAWDAPDVAENVESVWTQDVAENAHRRVIAELIRDHLPEKTRHIVEVGCGTGRIFEAVRKHLETPYYGVDLSERMLLVAGRLFPEMRSVLAPGDDLPFPDAGVDVTLCFEVLGHIVDPLPVLRDVLRVTRKRSFFTFWVSDSSEAIRSTQRFAETDFPVNLLPADEIESIIDAALEGREATVNTLLIRTDIWVYVVSFEDEPIDLPRIAPYGSILNLVYNEATRSRDLLQEMAAEKEEIRDRLRDAAALSEDREERLRKATAERDGLALSLRDAVAAAGDLKEQLAKATTSSSDLRDRLRRAIAERDGLRHRSFRAWVGERRAQPSAPTAIGPQQRLLDDSALFLDLSSYRLAKSVDVRHVPFLVYPLDLDRPGLRRILVAPSWEVPPSEGLLGIEIVGPDGEIVLQRVAGIVGAGEGHVSSFEFPPLTELGRYWLRLFGRGLDEDVRVLEWRSSKKGLPALLCSGLDFGEG